MSVMVGYFVQIFLFVFPNVLSRTYTLAESWQAIIIYAAFYSPLQKNCDTSTTTSVLCDFAYFEFWYINWVEIAERDIYIAFICGCILYLICSLHVSIFFGFIAWCCSVAQCFNKCYIIVMFCNFGSILCIKFKTWKTAKNKCSSRDVIV